MRDRKPGSGGRRPGSGRPKLYDEKTAPIRIQESVGQGIQEVAKNDKPWLEDLVMKRRPLSLDEFDTLPTFEWYVSEILPSVGGGITARTHMTLAGEAEVAPLRQHIRSLVESGALQEGRIRKPSLFSIEVFFAHPGWTGQLVGYRIDLAPDQYNFTTLRRHCEKHLGEGSRDFVGPIVVHQSDADTIEVIRQGATVTLNLLRDPHVPTRYAAFEAPGTRSFTFDSEEAAEFARHIAQHIIDKSTAYMDSVNQEFGLGKYRREDPALEDN